MVKVFKRQQKTFIDDRKFLRTCVQDKGKQNNISHSSYGTTVRICVQSKYTSSYAGRRDETLGFSAFSFNIFFPRKRKAKSEKVSIFLQNLLGKSPQ